MASETSERQARNDAIRCAKLRRELLSLSTISRLTGIKRGKIYVMVKLGERLMSLEES